jgi:hypothetical protein
MGQVSSFPSIAALFGRRQRKLTKYFIYLCIPLLMLRATQGLTLRQAANAREAAQIIRGLTQGQALRAAYMNAIQVMGWSRAKGSASFRSRASVARKRLKTDWRAKGPDNVRGPKVRSADWRAESPESNQPSPSGWGGK